MQGLGNRRRAKQDNAAQYDPQTVPGSQPSAQHGKAGSCYGEDGNEVEGLAPGGEWAAVECGKQDKPGLPELDICKLELRENGRISVLVRGRFPGSTSDISNPVVSPDGKWLVFQRSDSASGDIGEGYGIYRLRLSN